MANYVQSLNRYKGWWDFYRGHYGIYYGNSSAFTIG